MKYCIAFFVLLNLSISNLEAQDLSDSCVRNKYRELFSSVNSDDYFVKFNYLDSVGQNHVAITQILSIVSVVSKKTNKPKLEVSQYVANNLAGNDTLKYTEVGMIPVWAEIKKKYIRKKNELFQKRSLFGNILLMVIV